LAVIKLIIKKINVMQIKNGFTKLIFAGVLFLVTFWGQLLAQHLDVPYVPTPNDVVDAMLEVTNTGPGDYVIDLGSGDGRIVIAAAKRGAFGHGIDLNPVRVEEAEENARKSGVSDRVIFLEGDLFDADISRATVVTMYLLSSVNLRLKPVLFEQLRPGTRVVSHSFSMGDWRPDETLVIDNRHVYYWVIPANVKGSWEWESNGELFTMNISQTFQEITPEVRSGNRALMVTEPTVIGDRISFSAVNRNNGNMYVFSGIVEEETITGTCQVRAGNLRKIEDWTATLTRR
jgi:SAM-dependent methyltransferase